MALSLIHSHMIIINSGAENKAGMTRIPLLMQKAKSEKPLETGMEV